MQLFFLQMELGPERTVVMQPGQQARPERVARANGVDNMNLDGVDAEAEVAVGAERTQRPQRDHDETGALAQDLLGGALVGEVGIEPGKIRVARLDDRALRHHVMEAVAVLGVRHEPDPDVGVHDHDATVALAMDQVDEGGRHRVEYMPQRSEMMRLQRGATPYGEILWGMDRCRC